jgi:hypothetical protein
VLQPGYQLLARAESAPQTWPQQYQASTFAVEEQSVSLEVLLGQSVLTIGLHLIFLMELEAILTAVF